MKILIVEDNNITANVLVQELSTHHYTVETSADGQTALELAQAFHYDLLVVDIMLPKLDGISLCRQLRSHNLQMPILLLSAKNSSTDRVMGLEAGADDYVIKPYERSELIARIQALLRRRSSSLTEVLTWDELQLDSNSCQVTYDKELLHLTPKEYSILELFLRNPRRIFSRNAILDHIWLSDEFPQENAVSTHIKGLRQKLKAAGMTTDLIETVYGLGYRLKAPPSESPPQKVSQEKAGDIKAPSRPVPTKHADLHQARSRVLAVVQQMLDNFKENLGSKMALFEQAESQLSTGTLESELRQEAQVAAHQLIGSLGSFGIPEGSKVARQIEQLLRLDPLGQNEARQFEELIGQLKQTVEKKPLVPTVISNPKTVLGRFLVIDNDVLLTQQIEQEAISWGLQVDVVRDPTIASSVISEYSPDVILLNVSFGQTTDSGLNLLAELTRMTPSIPVLVMAQRNQLSDRVEVAQLGRHTFLQKPTTPQEVLKAVTQELNRTQKAEAKVLIVDDDIQVLTALSTLLEPWGLHVTTLAEPEQFWQVLEASAPNLLILDIAMPGFSGIELCQVVRNDPHWLDLPVLFLSGYNDAETVHQVFAVGADDYVQKPIVGPELIARILNRLERTRILKRFGEIDELTGIATRRKSIQDIERLLNLAERQNQPLCFVILDLDRFKQINDQHGHEAGDKVLCLFGKHLRGFFRREDAIGRWGGEEFVLALYGITREEGVKRLIDFLKIWRKQEFIDSKNRTFQVTFSAGVADSFQDGVSLQELYQAADVALYRAKETGREQVFSSQRSP